MDVLRWHVATQLTTPEQKASELLFPAEDGRFRSVSFLKKAFATVGHLVGLNKKLTPKGMRRTFNDLMRLAKVEAIVTKSISGHQTDRMREHYSTATPDEQRRSISNVVTSSVPDKVGRVPRRVGRVTARRPTRPVDLQRGRADGLAPRRRGWWDTTLAAYTRLTSSGRRRGRSAVRCSSAPPRLTLEGPLREAFVMTLSGSLLCFGADTPAQRPLPCPPVASEPRNSTSV